MFQKILASPLTWLVVVIVALGVYLKILSVELSEARSDLNLSNTIASSAKTALGAAEAQNGALLNRLDALDSRITSLGASQEATKQWLAGQMAGLQNIQKQPGDSDASISCLDTAVPAALSSWLRPETKSSSAGSH